MVCRPVSTCTFVGQVTDACQPEKKVRYRTLADPGADLPDVILNLPAVNSPHHGASSWRVVRKDDDQSRERMHCELTRSGAVVRGLLGSAGLVAIS